MSNRYAPLPNNPQADGPVNEELEAAFESDDEDNDSESHPLNPTSQSPLPATSHAPGTYDFDAPYDYPPPGSPPRPSAVALPNEFGNSNGITTFTVDTSAQQRRGWFGRTAAAVLPTHYVQRLGFGQRVPTGPVGGGNGDGVWANLTSKPTPPRRIQDGDQTYIVPEDSQAEAPPSYASAQADSVPPYWETTVHAPFSPDSMGEVVIDSLPTGSLFSFMWNMLVSISFQFVGFLLTYLLHTSHAARLGSRAGLGITLIQYGFALRTKLENVREGGDGISAGDGDERPGWQIGEPKPSEDDYITMNQNSTLGNSSSMSEAEAFAAYTSGAGITTTEWVSFFLMTIGWFVLLTSLLGFWRVKRWERGILTPRQPAVPRTAEESSRDLTLISNLEHAFGMPIISRRDLRAGLGLGRRDSEREYVVHETAAAGRTDGDSEREPMMPVIGAEETEITEEGLRRAQAMANDRRLRQQLEAAGFL